MINSNHRNKLFIAYYFFIFCCIHARESDVVEQLKIGNLAVSGTMQPVPFLGFGENIIDRCDTLGCVFPNWTIGKDEKLTEIVPSILYGVTNHFSILLEFPTAISNKQEDCHSSGSSDLTLQFEYAYYLKQKETWFNELTVVASLILPTGNECKKPPTGLGSPNFFLGLTASHLAIEWYFYASAGAFFATPQDNHTKIGNRFLYEFGFGKNIAYSEDKWILMWMVEFAGLYTQKSKVRGVTDQNSGSNRILLGPSLWFSTQRIIIQTGIAPVILHHRSGEQSKTSFFAGISACCKFN